MSHHMELDEILPWQRRQVARNTGRKCERSQISIGHRAYLKHERDARLRADEAFDRSQSLPSEGVTS